MHKGNDALKLVGMPICQGQQFGSVATKTGTIIMSRAPGIYATQLIEESYATKGFHNKAKSCNWGPMAGFVTDEPLFSKVGLFEKEQKKQQKRVNEAIKKGAGKINLVISEARRQWLIDKGLIILESDSNESGGDGDVRTFVTESELVGNRPRVIKYRAGLDHVKGDQLELAGQYRFFLRTHRTFESSGRTSDISTQLRVHNNLWEVWFKAPGERILPVQAMVDPNFKKEDELTMPDYKVATTADFDLFATWGYVKKIKDLIRENELKGETKIVEFWREFIKLMDMRPASSLMLRSYYATEEFEDGDVGNITPRLALIVDELNEAFKVICGYEGGNLVHHSDEAGRPKIDDVDYPIIVFFPEGSAISKLYQNDVISIDGGSKRDDLAKYANVKDELRTLIKNAEATGYQVNLNPGWARELNDGLPVKDQIYLQYVIQSDPKANPFSQENIAKYKITH